jgi:tRNA threonylcarbamoyladenosine biosynthesis protein TsaB
MIVLGFDTATSATAVGLRLADGRVLEGRDDPPAGERPGHSTRLLGLAHDLLRQARLGWRDIERIAVGVGPGTFTGLRIGVASARGIAQSLGLELVGVSSLRALAHAALANAALADAALADAALADAALGDPAAQGHDRVLSAIDARRGEVFVAAYRGEEELIEPQPLSPERLSEALEPLKGDSLSDWVALGDGAVRFERELQALGIAVARADSPLHRVSGRAVCELAARAPSGSTSVLPSYCRVPDAEASLQGVAS